MRKSRFFTILILLVLVLSLLLVGCTPPPSTPETPGGGEKTEVDIEKALGAVQNTLTASQKQSEKEQIYSIKSSYSIDVAEFKFTMVLDANFNDTNPVDSTIYVKVFDDEYNVNRLMAFYKNGNLLLETLGGRVQYADFASSSFFTLFYNACRMLDLSKLVLSKEVIDMVGDFILLKPFIAPENVVERKVGTDGKYYEFKNINLDTVKEKPNKLIKDLFAPFGDKLDALTIPVLGVPFSRLARIQIGTFTADLLSMASQSNLLKEFDFGFSGVLDSRENYNIKGHLALGFVARAIEPIADDAEGGTGAPFEKEKLDEFGYTGTIGFGGQGQMMMQTSYQVEILVKSNNDDNKKNLMSVLLRSPGSATVQASAFYKDGKMYVDLGQVMGLLGNGFGLAEMGFPKASTDAFNMSQAVGTMIAQLEKLIRDAGFGGGTSGSVTNATRDMLLKKLSSDQNGYINLRVDKELLTYLAGGEANVITYISDMLGMDATTVARYFNSEVFNRLVVTLKYNLQSGNFILICNDGKNDILTLDLMPKKFDQELLNQNLAMLKPADYKTFVAPKDVGLSAEGMMSASEAADFSKFFGAFIGDCYGKNTPIWLANSMGAGAVLRFKIEALSKSDGSYQIHAKIWSDQQVYLELWGMQEGATPMLYVDYRYLNLKYKIEAEQVKRALSLALGQNNIFVTGDIVEIFSKILEVADVSLQSNDISLKIYKNATSDPLFDIFGIRGLTAIFNVAVKYSFAPELFDPTGAKADYIVPEFDPVSDRRFNSLYDAEWWEKIEVKNLGLEMFIPYDPKSIEIVDGQWLYSPVGMLFGKEIRYYLVLSDKVNGTKKVQDVANSSILIDPWAEVPFKDTMKVLYVGGEGELPFKIDDFSPSLINPQGMDLREFMVHFGTGKSIFNTQKKVAIEVETRTLDFDYSEKGFQYQKQGEYTIVGEVQINPLKFFTAPQVVLPTEVKFHFKNIRAGGNNALSSETFATEWDYNYAQNMVTVGSMQLAVLTKMHRVGSTEPCSAQKFAYRVVVQSKAFSYIKVMTESGSNSYTIDVLAQNTYLIPKISTAQQEIRIYFADGTFSTIGNKVVFAADEERNCYLPGEIDWKYAAATVINANGSSKPFGDTALDTASYRLDMSYGGFNICVGEFALTLDVKEPASSLLKAGSIYGVTENLVTGVELNERKKGNFDYHRLDLGFGMGFAFQFKPYERKALPSIVPVAINTARGWGEETIVIKTYPIQWQTAGNILTADGMLAYPSAADTTFKVVGVIGDGRIRHEVVGVVHNNPANYTKKEYFSESADGTLVPMSTDGIIISAYDPYLLPTVLRLTLESGEVFTVNNVKWKHGNAEVKAWSRLQYNAYLSYLNSGKGTFNILDYIKNPQPNDGVGDFFPNTSQNYALKVSVSTVGGGLYENDIPYSIKVNPSGAGTIKFPLGKATPDGTGTEIDPYTADSNLLSAQLSAPYALAAVKFAAEPQAKYYPVTWDAVSLSALQLRLKAGNDSSEILLNGKIFAGDPKLEQAVVGKFIVTNRTIAKDGGIKFESLVGVDKKLLTYDIKNTPEEKVLTLKLLKPYSLTLSGAYCTPYDYLSEVLARVILVFNSGASNTYTTKIDFRDTRNGFHGKVLNFANEQNTITTFHIDFSGDGSSTDGMTVLLETTVDKLMTLSVSENLSRFQPNGAKLYPDGFFFPEVCSIEFSASQKMLFPIKQWVVTRAPSSGSSMQVGNVVNSIPVAEFYDWNSKVIGVSAEIALTMVASGTVRETIQIQYTYEINPNDMKDRFYNASSQYTHNGQAYQLNIESGVINFPSIFDFYGFLNGAGAYDKAKLPTTIYPEKKANYVQDNTFVVDWQMQAMPAAMDGFYTEAGVLIATAEVLGYGTSKQTVSLRAKIAQKSATNITAEGFNFKTEGQKLTLTLDPYQKVDGYSAWEATLPATVGVALSDSLGKVSNTVSTARYQYADGSAMASTKLLYHYSAFLDAKAEGATKNTLQLLMTLEDGTIFNLTVVLLNREVESVLFPYQTTAVGVVAYSKNTFYIDPYDTAFQALPTSAKVEFKDKTSQTLDFVLTPKNPANPFVLSYAGGEYLYQFSLYGYRKDALGVYQKVEPPQTVEVKIVVVPRALRPTVKAAMQTPICFEDGISAMLADITVGKNLVENDFIPATAGSYPADMALKIPQLMVWNLVSPLGNRPLVDTDFAEGMDINIIGRLADRTAGEDINLRVSAWKLTYKAIGTMVSSVFTPVTAGIIYNVFNSESVQTTYTIWFLATNGAQSKDVYFDFGTTALSNPKHRILWDESVKDKIGSTAQTTAPYRYGNSVKGSGGTWVQGAEQSYILAEVSDIKVDFGFNTADNSGATGRSVYVVDPVHPVFSTTAVVKGTIGGAEYLFGRLNVDWNSIVHDGNYYYNTKQVRITIRPSQQYAVDHYVELVNIDRHEYKYLVSDTTYTGATPIRDGAYYNITAMTYLDPILTGIYNVATNEYNLPRNLLLRFYGTPSRPEITTALNLYGSDFALTEARWWLGNADAGIRKIELRGNEGAPWPMVLNGATARPQAIGGAAFTIPTLKRTINIKENPFGGSKITIKNRAVTKTNITADSSTIFYAAEQYAVDPYNVVGTLPKNILLTMGGQEVDIALPIWEYTAADVRPEMIEGTAQNRNIDVKLKLFGETLTIKFPVKPRPLISEGMIDGGTFYVDKESTISIYNQLPKGLYFNFGWRNNISDYSYVPLAISAGDPVFVNPEVGKTYHITGRFGTSVNNNNFKFKIAVISPKLYALADVVENAGNLVSYRKLDYFYSNIPVSINNTGNILGANSVRNALPNYLWLSANTAPARILAKDFVYNAQNMATDLAFTAQYSFVSDDFVNPYLAVNEQGSKLVNIKYVLPVVNEQTSDIVELPPLDRSGAGQDGLFHFALGTPIANISMPKAIFNGKKYSIYWQFGGVNVNRRGSYSVTGTLILSDQKSYTFEAGIYIDPTAIANKNIVIGIDELAYTYSGKEKVFNVVLPNITLSDGTIGKPHYTLTYAKAGTTTFIRQQYLDAGNYILKVTIDDTNAIGERNYAFEIKKWVVSGLSWSTDSQFVYQDGVAQSPQVQNLPTWVTRQMLYFEVTELGDKIPLGSAPSNAGNYEVALVIADQNNCILQGDALKSKLYVIQKKAPVYAVEQHITYNGEFRHVPIVGVPTVLENGMSVQYSYSIKVAGGWKALGSDKIRNVGEYSVTVNINGGRNYASSPSLYGVFNIDKATLTVTIGDVESYYLKSIQPFTSNVKYSAPFGTDSLHNFSPLVLNAAVTERSVPGSYLFSVAAGSMEYRWNGTPYDNYNIVYERLGVAQYTIKNNDKVITIANKAELAAALGALQRGQSVSYFLQAGDYGDIVLSVLADVTLTGCYQEGVDAIAVTANSIKVQQGSIHLSLLRFTAKTNNSSIYLGIDAGDVSLSKCELAGADVLNIPSQSKGVYAERGYTGTVLLENTTIRAYQIALALEGGNLIMKDCTLASCIYGAIVQAGTVQVERVLFGYMSSAALVIHGQSGAVSVAGCRFEFNALAVQYSRPLSSKELAAILQDGENLFVNNTQIISKVN